MLLHSLRQDGLEIILSGDCLLPIDMAALEVVLMHLTQNAALHGASTLIFEADQNHLTVYDNGRGIAPGNRDRIFDPFFTTRRTSGGTGMGLAIVRTMLQAAGGMISVLPSDNGAHFELSFED